MGIKNWKEENHIEREMTDIEEILLSVGCRILPSDLKVPVVLKAVSSSQTVFQDGTALKPQKE